MVAQVTHHQHIGFELPALLVVHYWLISHDGTRRCRGKLTIRQFASSGVLYLVTQRAPCKFGSSSGLPFRRYSTFLVWALCSLVTLTSKLSIIRPPDIVVGGLRFYRVSSRPTSIFSVSYPPSSLNGTQPKPATCSDVSAFWKCMSEIWSMPTPYKTGPKNHFFDDFAT